jgi:hypothetical protein
MMALIRRIAILAGAAIALTPGAIFAGGDDYDATADSEGRGPAYYGFVRDQRGSPVSDARVVLRAKAGEPVVLKSNVLGLYRSHLSKDVRPDEVQVSCEKDGFKQVRVARRNAPGANDMNIETNCTLQRL